MRLVAGQRAHLVIVALFALPGCASHDIGKDCPELLAGTEAGVQDGSRTVTQENVGQDPSYPCDELICVASAGRPGYCSKKCREDAGCPDGFVCREVQTVGPFAGERFCVWATCGKAKECGDTDEFCCRSVPEAPPDKSSQCDFKDSGNCG